MDLFCIGRDWLSAAAVINYLAVVCHRSVESSTGGALLQCSADVAGTKSDDGCITVTLQNASSQTALEDKLVVLVTAWRLLMACVAAEKSHIHCCSG